MKIKDLLNESFSHPVIVVDVQPCYNHYIRFAPELMEFLNSRSGPTLIVYNDFSDDVYNMFEYYIDNGLNEEKFDQFNLLKKEYGFFRGWMDFGVSENTIIRVLREINRKNVRQSDELFDGDHEELEKFAGEDLPVDSIYFPDISPSLLKKYSGAYLCGGGENECLKEIMILMSVYNVPYKLMKKFIY